MNHRESPLYWSFPAGTWFLTQVRVSVFFPLVMAVLCFRLGFQLGMTFTGILFLSVLLHEFGHIVGARQTGGRGQEILIWPLGGLAFVQPANNFRSQFLTAAAGPLVNLMLCMTTLWPVLQSEHLSAALNPLILPAVTLTTQTMVHDLLLLTFAANWMLLLINLVPVYPLDGGKMLQTVLVSNKGKERGTDIYTRVGFFFAFVVMISGLFLDHAWVVGIGSLILVLNIFEAQQIRAVDAYDDSFMGYDFSQGYTSLEREEDTIAAPPRKGMIKRWKEKRQQERQQKQREREQVEELELDALLEKVHLNGIESLSDSERKFLAHASNKYRDRKES